VTVCIDGPAGVGKSSVSARVAARTGFLYLNSGSFYRAISRAVLDSGRSPEDKAVVLEIASRCRFELRDGELLLGGAPVGDLQNDLIDHWSPVHSRIPELRRVVNRELRRIAEGRDTIVEGRDMGTVVFPDAELKIYLDADLEARTDRRFRQGVSGLSRQEVRQGIAARDQLDRSKPVGRLARAADALYIDTSDLTIEQVCDRVVREIRTRLDSVGS
jgi:cytidylate kinase